MADVLPSVPDAYCGLWERTLLHRNSQGTLTSDRPARVFWMQTPIWHADLRIPLDRPDFSGVAGLGDCDDAQLAFIAGQEGFFGVTRVEGIVCTWLRLLDLRPGTALDIGRMEFARPDLLYERGIAEDYLEHWTRVENSLPCPGEPALMHDQTGALLLTSGNWCIRVVPRSPAAPDADPYAPLGETGREELIWRASLEITLFERRAENWTAVLSTHPWIEGARVADTLEPQPADDNVTLFGEALVS